MIVVADRRVVGVLRVNTALRRAAGNMQLSGSLGEIASRKFTLARADDIVLDVIQRLTRRGALMALVMDGKGMPRSDRILGVITNEHIAESVASNLKIYAA